MATKTRPISDDMRALARRLSDEADRHDASVTRWGGSYHQPLASDVLHDMAPHARLRASQAQTGIWYAYLSLPPGVRPRDGHWMYQETPGYYWTDTDGATKDEAVRKALHRLVDLHVTGSEDEEGD